MCFPEQQMENKNLSRPLQEGNPNQFRRPFFPRFFPRERMNNEIQREGKDIEDQRVQPPFQNNLLNEEDEVEVLEYEHLDQNINPKEESYEFFLTKVEYQNYEYFDDFSYTSPADIYQKDPKRYYNIISGAKQVVQIPKNKVSSPIKQMMAKSII